MPHRFLQSNARAYYVGLPVPIDAATRPPFTVATRGGGLLCAAYSVECIPGTVPPRATLSLITAGRGWYADDFCRIDDQDRVGFWRHERGEEQVPRRRCTCNAYPLLPSDLKQRSCAEGVGFELLQCSQRPLSVVLQGRPGLKQWPREQRHLRRHLKLGKASTNSTRAAADAPRFAAQSVAHSEGPAAVAGAAAATVADAPTDAATNAVAPAQKASYTPAPSRARLRRRLETLSQASSSAAAAALPSAASVSQWRWPAAGANASAAVDAGVDVLLATSDHRGHGFFATIERVLNQLLFAARHKLEPYVFLGPLIFREPAYCGQGTQPYYSPRFGDNVWDYFFVQPGAWQPGNDHVNGRPVRTVQVVSPESLYIVSDTPQVKSYQEVGGVVSALKQRSTANRFMRNGTLVRPQIKQRVDLIFNAWRARSAHILGVHMRGTDKVMRKKVPPEAYFPFIDAYIRRYPDALVFVATDEAAYLERTRRRYEYPRVGRSGKRAAAVGAADGAGDSRDFSPETADRVVFFQPGYWADDVIHGSDVSADHKGMQVLIDALLLSKCDFLLKSASSVAEFAIWVNLDLHWKHVDLQAEDRFKSQPLPDWASDISRNDAELYCRSLALGCTVDELQKRRASADQRLLGPGQQCARCEPRVTNTTMRALGRTHAVDEGKSCAEAAMRSLTHAECLAFARRKKMQFIGAHKEPSEFAGCVIWNGRDVEFNDVPLMAHTAQCKVAEHGGRCLCARLPATTR